MMQTDAPERRGSFWTSLAGVITALGTFIAAVGGVLAVLAAGHVWPFSPQPSRSSTPSTSSIPVGNIVATPPIYKFDDVQLGQAGLVKTITVTNRRSDVTTVSVSVSDESGSFEIAVDRCSTNPLNPGAACLVDLDFSPKKLGQLAGTLVLSLPGGEMAAQVALSGSANRPGR